MKTVYKIRLKGTEQYSMGVIKQVWSASTGKCYRVDFTSKMNKSKDWPDETRLKEHLLKYTKLMGMPADWEIVTMSTDIVVDKPIEDWFDAKMTMILLRR